MFAKLLVDFEGYKEKQIFDFDSQEKTFLGRTGEFDSLEEAREERERHTS